MNPVAALRRLAKVEAGRSQQAAVAFLPTAAQVAADLLLIDQWAVRLGFDAFVPAGDIDLAEQYLTDHTIGLPRLD